MKYLYCIVILVANINLIVSQSDLEVESLVLIEHNEPNPNPGTVNWNGSDFVGWTGAEWISLTAGTQVRDIDGNFYRTARIGDQVWMSENLRVTKYNDGSDITLGSADWSALGSSGSPAYCWYDNDQAAVEYQYGALYNFFVVDSMSNSGKNVCPVGWEVPSEGNWTELVTYLGGASIAGGKLKELSTWSTPNAGADNVSGFFGLPGGRRGPSGTFAGQPDLGYWRTRTSSGTKAQYASCSSSDAACNIATWDKRIGFSVRCIKE